jgi:hypothetical protein
MEEGVLALQWIFRWCGPMLLRGTSPSERGPFKAELREQLD